MKTEIPYRPWIMTQTTRVAEVLRLSLTTSTLCITHQKKGEYHHHLTPHLSNVGDIHVEHLSSPQSSFCPRVLYVLCEVLWRCH